MKELIVKFLIARLKPGLYNIYPLIHPAKPSEGNFVNTIQQQNIIRGTREKSLKCVATLERIRPFYGVKSEMEGLMSFFKSDLRFKL